MTLSTTDPDVAITILHVADCPNVETLRKLIQRAVATLGLNARVEEIEGPYPSPTLLVNGTDVIPRPDAIDAACRLDLPTEAQIFDALAQGSRGQTAGTGGHHDQDGTHSHLRSSPADLQIGPPSPS